MGDESRYPSHCRMMREALRQKGWQQDVIAAIMGQSRSTVNAILTNRQRLTARDAFHYGLALRLSPDDLLREQNAWLLSVTYVDEAELKGIRLRAATMDARVAGDAVAEIESLQKEREAIDRRIAVLTTRLQIAN